VCAGANDMPEPLVAPAAVERTRQLVDNWPEWEVELGTVPSDIGSRTIRALDVAGRLRLRLGRPARDPQSTLVPVFTLYEATRPISE